MSSLKDLKTKVKTQTQDPAQPKSSSSLTTTTTTAAAVVTTLEQTIDVTKLHEDAPPFYPSMPPVVPPAGYYPPSPHPHYLAFPAMMQPGMVQYPPHPRYPPQAYGYPPGTMPPPGMAPSYPPQQSGYMTVMHPPPPPPFHQFYAQEASKEPLKKNKSKKNRSTTTAPTTTTTTASKSKSIQSKVNTSVVSIPIPVTIADDNPKTVQATTQTSTTIPTQPMRSSHSSGQCLYQTLFTPTTSTTSSSSFLLQSLIDDESDGFATSDVTPDLSALYANVYSVYSNQSQPIGISFTSQTDQFALSQNQIKFSKNVTQSYTQLTVEELQILEENAQQIITDLIEQEQNILKQTQLDKLSLTHQREQQQDLLQNISLQKTQPFFTNEKSSNSRRATQIQILKDQLYALQCADDATSIIDQEAIIQQLQDLQYRPKSKRMSQSYRQKQLTLISAHNQSILIDAIKKLREFGKKEDYSVWLKDQIKLILLNQLYMSISDDDDDDDDNNNDNDDEKEDQQNHVMKMDQQPKVVVATPVIDQTDVVAPPRTASKLKHQKTKPQRQFRDKHNPFSGLMVDDDTQ